jgi:predicted nucleotidyltransferase
MSEVAFEWDFSSPEQEVLAEVPRRLAALHPRKIVLFGSRAEGTARKDSDYDLLVVMELDDPAGPRSVPVQRLLQGLPVPFDVIVYTPEEWEAFRTHPLALAHRIAETGRVLYDAP